MGTTNYLILAGGVLVVDLIAMTLVGRALKTAEVRRKKSSAKRRWTTRRIVRLTLGSALCVVLLATLLYPLARHFDRTRVSDTSWVRLMPLEGNFSVELPGRPDVRATPQHTPGGVVMEHSATFEEKNGLSFSAISAELPAHAHVNADPMITLSNVRDSILDQKHLKLLHSKAVTQSGLTGIEFACENLEYGQMLFRCFLTKDRLYTLWVGHVTEGKHTQDVQHFFDSFQME